jgi:ATP-dependent RNA helicase DDX1
VRSIHTFFTRPSVSTFDRVPFQLTDELFVYGTTLSATLHSPEIALLSEVLCENPSWVDLKGKDATPETVHHAMVMIDDETVDVEALSPRAATDNVHAFDDVKNDPAARRSQRTKLRKPHALKAIVDKYDMDQCLIFCRTNFDCDNLETFLNTIGGDGGRKHAGRKLEKGPQNPYSCVVLGGARSTEERRRNLKLFKEGDVRFLVCTDVAARGLDIKGLPFVVQMTLPDRSEDYVHRCVLYTFFHPSLGFNI